MNSINKNETRSSLKGNQVMTFLFVGLVSFLFVGSVHGAIISDAPENNTDGSLQNFQQDHYGSGWTGVLTSVTFLTRFPTASTTYSPTFLLCSNNTYDICQGGSAVTRTIASSTIFNTTTSDQYVTLYFPVGGYTLSSTLDYYSVFSNNGVYFSGTQQAWWRDSTNPPSPLPSGWPGDSIGWNVLFNQTPSSTSGISLVFPVTSSTIPDFTRWILDISLVPTSSLRVGVEYVFSGLNFPFWDDSRPYIDSAVSSTFSILKTHPLWIGLNASTTSWFARSYYTSVGTTTRSYGSTINFNINNNTLAPTSTVALLAGPFGVQDPRLPQPQVIDPFADNVCGQECSISFTASSTGFGRCIAYGMCLGIRGTFLPSDTSLSNFRTAFLSFAEVFPFSVIFNITSSTIQAINTYNVSTTEIFELKIAGLNGEQVTYLTLDSSTMVRALTNPSTTAVQARSAMDNVFQYVNMLIWMVAGLSALMIILHL